ncbi:pancreatic lipase-related protein 2-like [Melanaphis sacchari]|uniref:Pancreatic lipase-related protein 2 n=1 Tax=Melanaphis sacchari TaxID=742174 RepID=A0A2H8TVS9_9HEMI|nr:pancreatic lipase-related protein 2-like [Melanaphis sacchari]
MITTSKYFMSSSNVMLLIILQYCIVLPSGNCLKFVHTVDYSIKNQDPTLKEIHFSYNKLKIYNISNHVFYWLYTREQPNGQLLNMNDPSMIKSTNFNVKNPIKILVHDWLGSFQEKEYFCTDVVKAYLSAKRCNVICVDWMQFSFELMYTSAKINAKHIGYDIAKVLNILTNNMSVGSDNIHLIGHGMGAHIVGYTGKKLNGQIPRITGLDPVMPLYINTGPKYRINKDDATFVDIIHTNGNSLGLFEPLGHIDFYPNGGKSQLNCKILDKVTGGACSHAKALEYFAYSILTEEVCKAYQCTSWNEYKTGKCSKFVNSTYMGEHVDKKQTGSYYL